MSVLGLILAGGMGSRLGVLTEHQAKPALPFAGKYRLIDFALSNLVNSSVNHVAVLAQFNAQSLEDYLGKGEAWGLGVGDQPALHMWVPSIKRTGQEKYLGTADAVQQNRKYITKDGSDTVLIVPGDHISKFDFRQVLKFHQEKQADLTILVARVDAKLSDQYGMLDMDAEGRITRFIEKPAHSDLVTGSLGVYVFNTPTLLKVLEADGALDFGTDVIPRMVESGAKVYGLEHTNPWSDIGTLQSLYQANLALLAEKPFMQLYDPQWVIHNNQACRPPVLISRSGRVTNSLVSDGCVIDGEVIHCVLGPGVRVEWGAALQDTVVLADTVIHSGKLVSGCIIDHDTEVYKHHHG